MKTAVFCSVAMLALASMSGAQTIFNFDNGPVNTATPVDQFSDGITAHFSHEGAYPYAIWSAGVWGFTPAGFSGLCLWPSTVYRSDLYISFSTQIDSISMLYAPEEYATDSSCTMRLSAYLGGTLIGTVTHTNPNPGTWPTDTLAITPGQAFDNVVVHYQAAPVTGGDYGPIFAIDNVQVTPVPEPATLGVLGLGAAILVRRRQKR